MAGTNNAGAKPERGIWRRFLLLVPLAIVLAIASYLHIRSVCSTYDAWTRPGLGNQGFSEFGLEDVTMSNPGVVEVVAVSPGTQGSACVTLRAMADGETDVYLGDDALQAIWGVRVVDGAILVGGANFSGWEAILISLLVLLGAAAALLVGAVRQLGRSARFGYEMVACGGALMFVLFQLAVFGFMLVRGSLRYFTDMAFQLTNMVDLFVMVSVIPVSLLVLAVAVSNVSLIRHEGLRPVNLLGIALAVVWFATILFWSQIPMLTMRSAELYSRVRAVEAVVAVAIAYGECLLLSTIACAWQASRHVPNHAADYLVVLGCGIRADGTPSPLLAGRVDLAREFDESRQALGDAPARFVPSGGQGPDEVMSEAQSMEDYLASKGVDRGRIVQENHSATTRENMVFSREVIERDAGRSTDGLRVVFSTTNYHVFRGYVCAREAGMDVEGLGARTKAYFWPNAFLREFVGLHAAPWKGIALGFVLLAAVYAIAGYVAALV